MALPILLGLGSTALGAEVAIPPSPARWATDTTGFLDAQTVATLDARLEAYQGSTGHQVLVYVTRTTGDTPTEDWTVRAFKRWKVGRKGLDDGLVLFVFPTDHKVRIEVGYGLEQTVPDATAARIIRDITPKIKAGDPDGAVTAGVDEILGAIGGVPSVKRDDTAAKGDVAPRAPPAPLTDPYDSTPDGSQKIGIVLGILISLLVIVGVGWLVSLLPHWKEPYISHHSGGDGWGLGGMLLGGVLGAVGGGGFSGGGGLSGGGGATGSW